MPLSPDYNHPHPNPRILLSKWQERTPLILASLSPSLLFLTGYSFVLSLAKLLTPKLWVLYLLHRTGYMKTKPRISLTFSPSPASLSSEILGRLCLTHCQSGPSADPLCVDQVTALLWTGHFFLQDLSHSLSGLSLESMNEPNSPNPKTNPPPWFSFPTAYWNSLSLFPAILSLSENSPFLTINIVCFCQYKQQF